ISYDSRSFIINGRQTYLAAGEIHYFRIPHTDWEDRIRKSKKAGLNAVSIYVPWNFHEFNEKQYEFTGDKNIFKFIELCKKYKLYVIVRPGPYICAEWDFGGLPAWLNKYKTKPRTHDPVYMKYVRRWFNVLVSKLADYQITKGGPVIMVQVENEYGSFYRYDKKYLQQIADIYRKNGITVPLFTCDGTTILNYGYLPGTIPGTNGKMDRELIRKYDKNVPYIIPEFYSGTYYTWGNRREKHAVAADATHLERAEAVKVQILLMEQVVNNINIIYYIWSGGTNFANWSGRTVADRETFPLTCYDMDAPISEDGTLTEKYHLLSQVHHFIQRNNKLIINAEECEVPEVFQAEKCSITCRSWKKSYLIYISNNSSKAVSLKGAGIKIPAGGSVLFTADKNLKISDSCISGIFSKKEKAAKTKSISFNNWLQFADFKESEIDLDDSGWQKSSQPKAGKGGRENLVFPGYADRLTVYINGRLAGRIGSFLGQQQIMQISCRKGINKIAILADNLGRYGYSRAIGEKKGLYLPVYREGSYKKFTDNWQYCTSDNISLKKKKWLPMQGSTKKLLKNRYTWFRKEINVTDLNKKIILKLDGSTGCDISEIFINSKKIGKYLGWRCANFFDMDISRYLKKGRNVFEIVSENEERFFALPRGAAILEYDAKSKLPGPYKISGGLNAKLKAGKAAWSKETSRRGEPCFYLNTFKYQQKKGLYVIPEGLEKGYLEINGRNIGRFMAIGPQTRYWVPAGYLKKGSNKILIFDEYGKSPENVRLEY
ncbi:MAG: beta-galactosidase, partial [Planctomycetota bacterium]